jgi:hypothetical protein
MNTGSRKSGSSSNWAEPHLIEDTDSDAGQIANLCWATSKSHNTGHSRLS